MGTRQIGYKGIHRPAAMFDRLTKLRVAVAAIAVGLSLMAIGQSAFAAAPAVPQRLTDQLATCQDIRAAATTPHVQAWADDCITGAQAAIAAWVAAHPDPTPSPTVTASATPTSSPSASPTTTPPASPTATATPTVGPSVTPTVGPVDPWPNASNTGVPAGTTLTTRTTDLRVTTAGSTVQGIRFINASLIIDAANVTVRNVEIQGGVIDNRPSNTCRNGMVLDHVTIMRAPGQVTDDSGTPAVGTGGYTARYVKIDGLPEGFRVGGAGSGACGPVVVDHSYTHIVSPDRCTDWHGDGLQGYDGPAMTVRHSTMWLDERGNCGGTAPFFYPALQGNTRATIDGLIVRGGGFSFRDGMPGSVQGLKIVEGEWGYGPIDAKCSVLSPWQADIVRLDANGQPTTVRAQACNTETNG